MRLNDPAMVRCEYQDEAKFAVRAAAWASATGPDPKQIAFDAVAEVEPRRVLEVGPGPGEFSEQLARKLGVEVYAVDQSERMVELTRARGVEAIVGDVQDLPFVDGAFDCAVAAWMLYHVPDLDLGLSELRRVLRPGGRLVAVTNSERNLHELWDLFGEDARPHHPFSVENGAAWLLRHFTIVEQREARGTVVFPDREAAYRYVAAAPTRSHLADRLPFFDGRLESSRHAVVFVCGP